MIRILKNYNMIQPFSKYITLSSADGNMVGILWQHERSEPQKAGDVTGQTETFCYDAWMLTGISCI